MGADIYTNDLAPKRCDVYQILIGLAWIALGLLLMLEMDDGLDYVFGTILSLVGIVYIAIAIPGVKRNMQYMWDG